MVFFIHNYHYLGAVLHAIRSTSSQAVSLTIPFNASLTPGVGRKTAPVRPLSDPWDKYSPAGLG